jgi:hypothetical protein
VYSNDAADGEFSPEEIDRRPAVFVQSRQHLGETLKRVADGESRSEAVGRQRPATLVPRRPAPSTSGVRCRLVDLMIGSVHWGVCTTHRRRYVSKHLESIVQTDIKTSLITKRQGSVSKLFNALHVAKTNYK